MDFKYVYKICTKEEWKIAKKIGKFEGSKKDKEDGFIHFSDKDQLKAVSYTHLTLPTKRIV